MRPVLVAVVLLLGALLAPARAVAEPPPNPSDAQISAAEQARNALAAELGSLQAQAASLQGQILDLQSAADAAIAEYQRTTQAVIAAIAAADAAKAALDTANADAERARRTVQTIARDTFVQGSTTDTTAALLFGDSADVDFALAATGYLAQRRESGLQALTVATVAAANAESTRRSALQQAQDLQRTADEQQQVALASLETARVKQEQLQTTLTDVNQRAAQAAAQLSGLQDQRAAYDAYLAEQARKAAEAEAARRAAAAAAAQAAAARGGGGGGSISPPPPAPSAGGTWAIPLRSYRYISSGYGYREGGFHYGIDFSAPEGTPMYAVGPGRVVASGPASGFGNWVVISHGDGSYSIYGHMRVLVARVGQQVNSNTLIAYVGNEGESSGAHLHFEVRLGSYGSSRNATNPVIWLAQRGLHP